MLTLIVINSIIIIHIIGIVILRDMKDSAVHAV